MDPLKPHQFQNPGVIPQFSHQPPASRLPQDRDMGDLTRHLDILRLGGDLPDQVDLRPVQVPVGKKIQQIIKGEDLQLLFQKIRAVGSHPFQVFDRAGKYGSYSINE